MRNSNKQPTLRAAAYLRVSTDEQAKEGHYGLDYQDAKTKSFGELQEYSLATHHIYRDEGYSGALPVESRPQLKALFDAARQREFDVLVVYKIDRLSRNLRNLLNMIHELESFGVCIRSVAEPFDTSSPYGKNTLQIMGSFAELEKELIKERMSAGRAMAAKAGKWVMGTPPYGYRIGKKSRGLEIDATEAKWVRKFFEWLVWEGCSLREIARRANNLHVPTKNEGMKTKRRHAKAWWVRTIGRMLTNETYTGTAHFRKYKTKHKDIRSWIDPARLNPTDHWITVPVPAIVSPELFQSALKRLKRNREMAARNAKQTYLFSKLIHCGRCGFRLKGSFANPTTPGGAGSKHYVGVLPRRQCVVSKRCRYCGSIAESRLLPVWEALKLALSEPQYVQEQLDRFLSQGSSARRMAERGRDIEAELRMLEEQRRRISYAYLEAQTIDGREYEARLRDNAMRRDKLVDENARMNRLTVSNEENRERADRLMALYERLKLSLDEPSYETMSQLIHLLVDRIDLHLDAGFAEIAFNFPETAPESDAAGARVPLFVGQPLQQASRNVEFTVTLKVPIISTEEWRLFSPLHLGRQGSYAREALAMTQLAVQKARELFL